MCMKDTPANLLVAEAAELVWSSSCFEETERITGTESFCFLTFPGEGWLDFL